MLFALVHWQGWLPCVLASYALSMASALVFLGFRNLWPLIIGHVPTDFVWFLLY